ncbi:MAG: molybdenum cofactor guanylyltransferase [Myxococcota bacterium]
MTSTPAVLVLAGGRSSRFGSEKALHLWCGKPLIMHVLQALQEGIDPHHWAVALGDLHARTHLVQLLSSHPSPLRLLADPADLQGPLAGLAAGLHDALNHTWLLACACDMPALAPQLLAGLVTLAQDHPGDAVVPQVSDRYEPLCALYRPQPCLRALKHYASTQRRSLQGWVATLNNVLVVTPTLLQSMEPNWQRSLANINRLDDLQRLGDPATTLP